MTRGRRPAPRRSGIDAVMDEAIRVEQHIAAPAATVFEYLTDGARWRSWQGEAAEVEPWPGGRFSVRMPNGRVASGAFVDVVPGRRVAFTWGWVGDAALPPGSSIVEIDLVDEGTGTTVRLTHRGLPAPARRPHGEGWRHYLGRLGLAATGNPPGPDPAPPGPSTSL